MDISSSLFCFYLTLPMPFYHLFVLLMYYSSIFRFCLLVLCLCNATLYGQNTFVGYEKIDQGILLQTAEYNCEIKALTEKSVELTILNDSLEPSRSLQDEISSAPTFDLLSSGKVLMFILDSMSVIIQKDPLNIRFYDHLKQPLTTLEDVIQEQDSIGFDFSIQPSEAITGGGSRVLGMDRKGKLLKLYNQASYGYGTEAELMYYSMPMVISSKKYMIVFDNTAEGYLDIGHANNKTLNFSAKTGRQSFYLSTSTSYEELSKELTQLTGKQPLPPKWMFGNLSSRMGYTSSRHVNDVVAKYKAKGIGVDAMILDLFWFGPELKGYMGNLEWDLDSFPNPTGLMHGLKQDDIHTILITEPFVLQGTKQYDAVIEKELVGKTPSGEPYHYDFYFGHTTLLDIFKQDTKDWFWNIYDTNMKIGVDGWWGDLGEPEVHPRDMMHEGGTGISLHNVYGHEWTKMLSDKYAQHYPKQRPAFLMRAGFVGSQKYGILPWSGDVSRSWEGLQSQVELMTTMHLQGLSYFHSDLGGFAGDYEDSELYLRWLNFGVFTPIFRLHAQSEVPSEPVLWDAATCDKAKAIIQERYSLIPYIYTAAYENSTNGTPITKPIFVEENTPDNFDITTEYLFGDDLLIAPVVEKGQTETEVYFPKGQDWYDFYKPELSPQSGGSITTYLLKDNTIPVFVKAGSWIPSLDVSDNFTNTTSLDYSRLKLDYYTSKSINSTGKYYMDNGYEHKTEDYEYLNIAAKPSDMSTVFSIQNEGNISITKQIAFTIHGQTVEPKMVVINDRKYKKKKLSLIEYNYNPEAKTVQFILPEVLRSNTIILK